MLVRPIFTRAFLTALLALWPCGCRSPAKSSQPTELAVFAASSLSEAFEDLKRGFEAQHPNSKIDLTFAGSQVLRLHIEQGAAADVFASANEAHMQALSAAGLVSQSRVFAKNELVVIVPQDNPAKITAFENLDRARRLVIGTANVPVGAYARLVLQRASRKLGEDFALRVHDRIVSEESNVRLVRAKVELGEADAAIVYRTDATASGRVRSVPIPSDVNVQASYPIALVSGSQHGLVARQFTSFVLSSEGQNTLARHGFLRAVP